jgi:hypothetical protein
MKTPPADLHPCPKDRIQQHLLDAFFISKTDRNGLLLNSVLSHQNPPARSGQNQRQESVGWPGFLRRLLSAMNKASQCQDEALRLHWSKSHAVDLPM